jgi:hypothetical protein
VKRTSRQEAKMIESLRRMIFGPRYPQRYIGRHRMPNGLPNIAISFRRSGDVAAGHVTG